ncbi:MAG: hypothetical protein K2J47_05990 [Ruminococcus sp.]|nr:hypothetical protein [Ruminococcus sp.]
MNKFAIYKSETGLYYYEYVDNLEQLKGTVFENIVTEDKLPVVLDGSGGYYKFTEQDFCFVELVETEKKCPLSLEKMFFKNHKNFKLGWLSPEGDTYSCSYTGHNKAAIAICEKYFPKTALPERTLGNAGWLKIIDSWDGTERQHGQFVYSMTGKITKAQADKLFDIGLYYNEEVQRMIEDCADNW